MHKLVHHVFPHWKKPPPLSRIKIFLGLIPLVLVGVVPSSEVRQCD